MLRRTLLAFAALVSLLFVFETAALAAANEGDFGETNLNIHNDWIIYIDVERKKNLFAYPESKLKPVTNVRVSYRKSRRVTTDEDELRSKLYEDLWYHGGKALGSHRFNKLAIEKQKRGTIYVRTTDDALGEPRAVANAIARLTVQLLIKEAIITTVVVPRDMFRELVTEFADLGFVNLPADADLPGMQISNYMVSNPHGMEAYLYYRKKR